MKKLFFLLTVVVLISLPTFCHLLKPGYFPMHDDMQAMRVFQLDKCLRDGQIPCRWVPDMGYGYGYPQFIYYSPLPYYLMEAFHLTGLSFLDSVKAGIILSFLLSGLGMFLLGKSLWGNLGGIISATFYLYAPYRAADVYSRGAVGEFWGLVFLPFIFWAILEFVRQERTKYLLFLALAYAGLLLSHNITSLAFTPVAVLWAIFLVWYFKKQRLLFKLLLGAGWGIGLASFFLLPAIFEKKFAHTETMTYGYFNFLAHFVSLRQLFFSTFWGYGSSELGEYDDLSFAIGTFHWLFAFLAPLIVLRIFKKDRLPFWLTLFFLAIFLFSAFLAHQRSVFIWQRIPILAYFQFPWRFLVLVIFAVSALAGAVVFKLKVRAAAIIGFLMIFGAVFLNSNYFRPSDWYNITDKDKFSGPSWEKQLTISIFDYLPIFAEKPPGEKAPDLPEILSGKAQIKDFKKGTNWQKGKILVDQEAQARLPLFYFPGFKIWLDGRKTPMRYDNPLGLVTFTVPPGEYNFLVRLTNTPVRTLGDTLTVISLLAIVGYLAYGKIAPKTK